MRFFALIVQIILARLLAPDVFGIMAILLVLIEISDVIAQSGLGIALIQQSNVSVLTFTTAFWLSMVISTGIYVAIFFMAPFIAHFYNMPDLFLYIRILSLVVFINAFNSIQRSWLQKQMDFKALFKSSVGAVTIAGFIGVIMAVQGFGVWSLIVQTLLQSLSACVIMLVQIPWRPSLRFSKKEAKNLLSYGWKICATGILNVLYTGLSELIIGKTCPPSSLGFYSQGRKWPNAAMGAFGNAIQNVVFPIFAEAQGEKQKLQNMVKKALVAGSYIIVPICFLSAVIADPLIQLLLTEAWLPCVPVFQLTCLGYAMFIPQVVNLRAYMAMGDSGLYMKLQVIKVATGVFFICSVAILTSNIYFIAWAVFIHGIFSVIVVDMHPAARMHGIGRIEQLKSIVPVIALSTFAALVASCFFLIDLNYIVRLAIQVIAYIISYLVGSSFFHIRGYQECLQILRGFRER